MKNRSRSEKNENGTQGRTYLQNERLTPPMQIKKNEKEEEGYVKEDRWGRGVKVI